MSGPGDCRHPEHARRTLPLTQPSTFYPFEAAAWRRYGHELTATRYSNRVDYCLPDLEVWGRHDPVPVLIRFDADNRFTYGLDPVDYPMVWADRDLQSPHRIHQRALCLFHPADPRDRRWGWEDGLLSLIDLARDHIFFETAWRENGHHWLGPEAPHGLGLKRK